MAKKFRVLTIALLGANNAMKKHGDVVTKEELTGSIDELISEGFIEEVGKSAEAKAKEEAEAKAKEEAEAKAKEEAEAKAKEEAEAKAKEEAEAKAKEEAEAKAKDQKNPLIDKLKNK